MLGKAGNIRTAMFSTRYYNPESEYAKYLYKDKEPNLDLQINLWCQMNKEAEILDIKFCTHGEGSTGNEGELDGYYSALIIYKI